MQKVEGSSPFSRLPEIPAEAGVFVGQGGPKVLRGFCPTFWVGCGFK